MGRERAREKEKDRREKAREENTYLETVSIPKSVASLQELNSLLKAIEQVRAHALKYDKMEVRFVIDQSPE